MPEQVVAKVRGGGGHLGSGRGKELHVLFFAALFWLRLEQQSKETVKKTSRERQLKVWELGRSYRTKTGDGINRVTRCSSLNT